MKKQILEGEKKVEFETFRPPNSYFINHLEQKEPSAFNGIVEIKKYKVIIEPIIESKEILFERLQYLWDTCDNWHNWRPIEYEAKKIGMKLIGLAGSKVKK